MSNKFLVIGASLAFLAVALGAFGAHGLKAILSPNMLIVFETGVRYHMYHAVGVIVAGWAGTTWTHRFFRYAGWTFIVGIIFFSGSLYVLSLTGIRWLGAITPLGGVMFLTGWLLLALGFYQSSKSSS